MIHKKNVGIWGFGIVGKAALPYLLSKKSHIEVLDAKPLLPEDQQLLKNYAIPYYEQKTYLQQFLEHNDYILASPGIDLQTYTNYVHKWITELDLLQQEFKKPIIAITGSVGKTSITSILGQLCAQDNTIRMYTGGNIGDGMLTLATQSNAYDAALLEVSSFQLEHCISFAPALAVWTTFYPNHLDRHGSLQAYFDAKFQLLARQSPRQQALVPATIVPFLKEKQLFSELNVLCDAYEIKELLSHNIPIKRFFFINGTIVYIQENRESRALFDLSTLPPLTFTQNWLIIVSTLYLAQRFLPIPNYLPSLNKMAQSVQLPEHRLELVASYNGITVYNDSKATTPSSTLAAIHALQDKPIVLLIGGLSKGIDRKSFIQQLKNKVKIIICFGKEANQLKLWCDDAGIPAYSFSTLKDAVGEAINNATNNSHILFSPAGSSFDLFKDYQERGTQFKKLIYHILA